jgi:2-keto-4-pentenoate hydratase
VQKQLRVNQPDFGILFADMQVGESEKIALARVLQPKIEAEVAFELGRDIDVADPTVSDVIRATAYVMPALEIVGSRIKNWDITIVDTIADNASSGLFVLGNARRPLDGLDLREVVMQMRRREAIVSEGKGTACLNNPLNAVAWLAGDRAGDIVLSGALGPMVPVEPGDRFEASISEIGAVSAIFADA